MGTPEYGEISPDSPREGKIGDYVLPKSEQINCARWLATVRYQLIAYDCYSKTIGLWLEVGLTSLQGKLNNNSLSHKVTNVNYIAKDYLL